MKKNNYSYVGIAFIILVFGIYFVPRIVDRITNKDVTRKESRSDFKEEEKLTASNLAFIEIGGAPKKVPNFSFKNQHGKLISNKDYLGKVYVIEFFFTTCPTICPRMNNNLVQIQKAFKDIDNFGVASFTINPSHDTPDVLNDYAKKHGIVNPNWHFLTGDKDSIYNLSNQGFNLYTAEDENVLGGFEHSGNFALIDKNGYIRSRRDDFGNPIIYYKGIVSETEEDEDGVKEEISDLKEDIQKLLNE